MATSNAKKPSAGFTATSTAGLLHEIILPCGVSLPFQPGKSAGNHPQVHPLLGLWDTGATGSVITASTAQLLSLRPIGKSKVCHAGGETFENVYLVNIYLPNDVAIPNVRVTECHDTNGRFGLIIGMDIITKGDFAITNKDGQTVITYRIPSLEKIDFSPKNAMPAELQTKKTGVNIDPNTARNRPCPCGSGKKYKHCHGKKKR